MRTALVVCAVLLLSSPALADSADLRVAIGHNDFVATRGMFHITGLVGSQGPDSPPAALRVTLPPQTELISAEFNFGGWTCAQPEAEVLCTNTGFLAGTHNLFEMVFQTYHDEGGRFPVVMTVSSTLPDPNPANNRVAFDLDIPRIFRVTSPADAGDGTLRQTILEMNAVCGTSLFCEALFPFPLTIEPLTPLPAITGCAIDLDATVDGAPSVTLSGARLASGHGLEVRATCARRTTLSGLAIGGFPYDGISIAGAGPSVTWIRTSYIGTDPTGQFARPNGSRGVTVESPASLVSIFSSILSGNARSGLFVVDGQVELSNTQIGVARDRTPLPNGASGIYLGRGFLAITGDGSEIAHNAHFGVAVQPGASAHVAANVHSNGNGAIDWGLDGPTPNRDGDGIPDKPELTEAFYDAATNQTIVRGRLQDRTSHLIVFANRARDVSGRAEMERRVQFTFPSGIRGEEFELAIAGDLRGQILTAVAHDYVWGDEPLTRIPTSEPSEGIDVR